jgi:hypothetical protein
MAQTGSIGARSRRLARVLAMGGFSLLLPVGALHAAQITVGVPAVRARHTVPVQQLGPPRSRERLKSERFDLVYDPARLSEQQAKEAGRLADEAWARCKERFGTAPDARITIDLNPDFTGATGFFRPGGRTAAGRTVPPLIGVRLSELDYLGLSPEYVFTHEIAHWFSGPLAGSSLGEGIADWAAGEYAGIPLRPWWGKVLREAGLWVEPHAYFVTGEFEESREVDARNRTAGYAEAALLVQYLVDRFGWAKVGEFAAEYARVRGPLNSNAARRNLPAPEPPRFRDRRRERTPETDPRRPPNPTEVEAVFQRSFGESWNALRTDWQRRMDPDSAPADAAERLVLSFRTYGAIRNYEMWLIEQKPRPSEKSQKLVREAFERVNAHLRRGELQAARDRLAEALGYVRQLREPRIIALAPTLSP